MYSILQDKFEPLKDKHVNTHYIEPGSPWQNAYNESFNSIFRTTCLDRYRFSSMAEARAIIDPWLEEYNTVRPHGSLGGRTPEAFLQRWTQTNMDQPPKSLTGRVDQKSWACQECGLILQRVLLNTRRIPRIRRLSLSRSAPGVGAAHLCNAHGAKKPSVWCGMRTYARAIRRDLSAASRPRSDP